MEEYRNVLENVSHAGVIFVFYGLKLEYHYHLVHVSI